MAAIGNSPTQQAFTPAIDYFSGNGSTTAFTLSRPVASVAQVQVVVNNVAQNPSSAYTISSNTITFTSAPSSGTNNIYVYYTSPITQVIAPGQGTVNTTALGNITNIASGNSSLTLQTGSSNTTAVTINTSQAIGVGSSPSYGTSGQVLTSGGSGAAPTWTTVSTSAATPTALGTVYGATGTTSGLTTFVGYNAGLNTNTGTDNVAIGVNALKTNTSGYEIVAIGDDALLSNTTGQRNTAVGHNVLRSNSTGNDNCGVGWYTLRVTTGSSNTALGSAAGNAISSGTNNTVAGYGAGSSINTGANNVCIGYSAGDNISSGTVNTCVGRNAIPNAATDVNETVIGGGFPFQGKGSNTAYIGGSSGAYNQANNASWSTTSDQRLKKNIVDNTDGLNKILPVRVRNFEYRIEEEITELPISAVIKKEGVQLGVIAQELQAVLPDCVKEESSGVLSVQTDNLTWYMVNAIKELKAINDTQAETINALTARIEALENK